MTRVLGIDPGLQRAGWGIVEKKNQTLCYVAHGVLSTKSSDPLEIRLKDLYTGIQKVIQAYGPEVMAIEEIFLNKNPHSTLKLGMARGVLILVSALHGIPLYGYSPNTVKKTVVGVGHADKSQITHMLKHILPKAGNILGDAADALAIAICHLHHQLNSFQSPLHHTLTLP